MSQPSPSTTPVPDPAAAARPPVRPVAGYWTQVYRRLRKNPIARWGLRCIVAIFVLATCAPLISSHQAIYWSVDGNISFPLFATLFNRLIYATAVDVFFNLLLVLSPIFAAILVWVARKRPRYWTKTVWGLLALHGFLFVLISLPSWGVTDNPFYHTEAIVNYREQASMLAKDGRPFAAIMPLEEYHYRETIPNETVQSPSFTHWLGTDTEGRDVFARMIFGTRISLTIGVIAVSIYVGIGIILGALAGYFGGWVDNLISRLIEVMICFPSFFLILTLAALIEERSVFHVMVIIGLTSWTGVARLIRAEFLKQRSLEYVQAAVALGVSRVRVIFRHILPNALAPVLVSATFGIGAAILVESGLAFLGVGDLTVASWGETLSTGRIEQKSWLILAPGAAIFFVVSVFNLVGEGLRDALDPKLRH